MKVSGETTICIVPDQKDCAYLSKWWPTEIRAPAAQRQVSIPVWTEKMIFGKGVNLELLVWGLPYEHVDHRV